MTTTHIVIAVIGGVLFIVFAAVVIGVLAARERAQIDSHVQAMRSDLKLVFDEALGHAIARGLDTNAASLEAWRASVKRLCEWESELLIRRLSRNGTATGRYAESRIRPIVERAYMLGEIVGVSIAESWFEPDSTKRMTPIASLIAESMDTVKDSVLEEI